MTSYKLTGNQTRSSLDLLESQHGTSGARACSEATHLKNIKTKHVDELSVTVADEEEALLPDVRTATEL